VLFVKMTSFCLYLSVGGKSTLITSQPAEEDPPVTVMSTATDADQAEYVSHMVQYLLSTNQVK
jgi:hypothetical protein